MDKDRHLIDCVSYILLDDPQFIDPTRRPSEFTPIYKNLSLLTRLPKTGMVEARKY